VRAEPPYQANDPDLVLTDSVSALDRPCSRAASMAGEPAESSGEPDVRRQIWQCGPADLLPSESAGNTLIAKGLQQAPKPAGHRIDVRHMRLQVDGRSSRTAHAVLDR
jgi:hypothetical protein